MTDSQWHLTPRGWVSSPPGCHPADRVLTLQTGDEPWDNEVVWRCPRWPDLFGLLTRFGAGPFEGVCAAIETDDPEALVGQSA